MNQPELYADVSSKIYQQQLSDVTKMVGSLTWLEMSTSRVIKVLDVGCGPGDCTARDLLPRLRSNCHVVGVDREPSMVSYASQRHAKAGVLSFQQVDIACPDIEATDLWREMAPYDKIFSYYCLHWVRDQRQAAKNMFKLLSDDNGEAILVLVARDGIAEAYRNMATIPRWRVTSRIARSTCGPTKTRRTLPRISGSCWRKLASPSATASAKRGTTAARQRRTLKATATSRRLVL